uniref:non-specific serine/threonine protein kinase n=1 Tax=Salix viminalis TaxID=40686 RepID=A0A6N2NAJ5_SALVM
MASESTALWARAMIPLVLLTRGTNPSTSASGLVLHVDDAISELSSLTCTLINSSAAYLLHWQLEFLRLLNLENNSLSSSIPGELGHLFRLQMLRLGNNSFSGEIPANISSCANLIALRLEGNNLTGKLPEQLESLSKLKVLNFRLNNLVGEIPPSFGNLSSIVEIRGLRNNLKGVIPHGIGRLKRLEIFSFGANNLSGTIPPSIFNLSTLTNFAVPMNQLHGTLPPDLGHTLPNLEIFLVHTNRFSGLIPMTISNASNLSIVELSLNFFTGKIPSLGSLPNLRLLSIGYNDLGSGQDDDLSFLYPLENNTVLEYFYIGANHLGGVVPEILGNFSKNLRIMEFGRNQIRGTIPDGIGNLVSLAVLGLESNQLGGMIPSSIGNMTSLIEADLELNNLYGSIPSNLGNCRNLLELGLSNNNLSGSIPKELLNISSGILYLNLSENHLTGSLPLEVGNLVNLGELYVSKNRLSGEIPHSLGSCASLELLSLRGNFFKGSIPKSLSSLRALKVLDLSHNNLSGQIPKLLGDLKLLENLDLSFNDLEVRCPARNKKLCRGIPQLNLSKCTTSANLKSSTKILIVTMSGGLLVVILVASSVLFYCFRKTKDKQGSSTSSWGIQLRRVAYHDLLLATNGFSSASLIGVGSFGSVYQGILPPDGMDVAVKVLNLLRKGAPKSFMAECAALVNIRHRNLVRVVSSCSSIDFQGNDFKAIVYELMVNGSLEEWLHPIHQPNNAQEMRCLNLIQKLNISIDVANALNYLHQHCETPIVHCDLKPSNVLLNAEMTACVGDFGLARLRPEVFHQLSSGQTSSVGLKGTIGYAAPEYGVGSDVSTYGDVYSFGILLLEMFTGKRPTDDMFKDGLNLHDYAEMALPGRVSEVVEPKLLREDVESSIHSSHRMNHTETGKTLECLISIIKIGVACSVELPRERMDIGNVVAELHRVRDILSGTRIRGQHEYVSVNSSPAPAYYFLSSPAAYVRLPVLFMQPALVGSLLTGCQFNSFTLLAANGLPVLITSAVFCTVENALKGLGLHFHRPQHHENGVRVNSITDRQSCHLVRRHVLGLPVRRVSHYAGRGITGGCSILVRSEEMHTLSLSEMNILALDSAVPSPYFRESLLGLLLSPQSLLHGRKRVEGTWPSFSQSSAPRKWRPSQQHCGLELAQITDDPFGALNSWNESFHFCEWSGVACGRRHQRVVELDLHSYKLVGGLSPSIGNLSFLRLLNLENNSLSSSIPGELGRLFRLQMLRLGNNSFSGEIPANISSCANLIALRLEGNNLTGKLPEQLESLSKLKVLNFILNNLVGEIPPSFGNLSSIVEIRGMRNALKGVIPHSIGRLKRLEIFSFSANNLSGTIPPSIFNLSSLTHFAVPVNQLHGTLPPDLGHTLPNLEILLVHTNRFSGLIPMTISNASNLSNVQLSYNFFTGKIPSLGSLPNLRLLSIGNNDLGSGQDDDLSFLYPLENNTVLEIFYIGDNHLGGVDPEILGNFSKNLRIMEFGRNQIRGTIPDGIGNLVSLGYLSLESNQLGGMIPSSIGKLQNLGYLYLYDNKISGSIPSSVGNMTSLILANLDLNNLHGSIPSNLGNCRNLLALALSNNNLSGSIPKELLTISSGIFYLNLSENHLTGSLPLEVGNLVHLGELMFPKIVIGEIPHSLGSCASLEILSLKGNLFKGSIPESLSSLRALGVLDLSHNNLSGQIPKLLGDLKLLESLDLSFNDLEGQVPVQGAFGNASVISMAGNKKLCGGIPQLNLSRCTTNESAKLKSSTKILIVTMSGGLLVVILVASSVLFYCFRKTKDKQGSSTSSWGYNLGDLQRNPSPDGMAVAVKVLNLLRKGAPRSFMAECAALVNIRHRNLVRVVTSCSSIDFQGNDFKAIVYELMVNGSLEEWLHPVHQPNNAQEMRSLNLIQKLNISIDVANALNYLHQHCETPVVHCDLKPSNVLLNAEMTACVEVSHQLSSGQTSSVGLKGTIGYAAPEYGVGSDVSTYGDVYSFGILLLEMFTGKRPTDDMFKDGLNLHNYAELALPGRVSEVVEPTLLREDVESSIHSSHRMNHTETGKPWNV